MIDCEHASCGTNYGNYKINIGDIWVIVGSIFWAVHVQVLSFAVKRDPIMLLAVLQFFFAGLILLRF